MPSDRQLRKDALAIFRAALKVVDGGDAIRRKVRCTRQRLTVDGQSFSLQEVDRIFVLAVGKAASSMAAALNEALARRITEGLIITKHGHSNINCKQFQTLETGHPIPDAAGMNAAARVEELLRELNRRDLLIVAVSGGASALLPAPVAAITLAAKQKTTQILLRAGADIRELNAVRKHLSRLKGGRLAALAYPATVVSLILSDVVGDPLDVIGSGLTAPDSSTWADALSVIAKYQIENKIPGPVLLYLRDGAAGKHDETPKAGNSVFEHVSNLVVAGNRHALASAAAMAKKLGYRPLVLSSTMEGEAREVARVHAEILQEAKLSGRPVRTPCCLLSGGETTVAVRGAGKGGRNTEFALAATLALRDQKSFAVLAAGTDGTDGPTDAAGAIGLPDTLARAAALRMSAREYLEDNNSYAFFDPLGDLVKTGPTGTNVMDLYLLLSS